MIGDRDNRSIGRYMSLGGIAGPLVFVVVVIVCGALRPGYNHMTQFISELGEHGGAYAALMNYGGFMPMAVLLVLFAVALVTRLPRTPLSLLGALLVAVFAVGVFAAGINSCDPGCVGAPPTRAQQLHTKVSIIAFRSLILATFVWGLYFWRLASWRRFAYYTLLTGVLAVGLLFGMITSIPERAVTGLMQRLFLGSLFLWLALMAWRVWRHPGGDLGSPSPLTDIGGSPV